MREAERQAVAAATRRWWRDWLGADPDSEGNWRLGEVRKPQNQQIHGQIRQLVLSSFGSELVCEFHRPTDRAPTGVVVIAPFYDTSTLFGESSPRTRRSRRDPSLGAYGIRLAQAGHAVLAVPWWFELVAAMEPATAEASTLKGRYEPAAERHRRERSTTGLGRSIGDLMLAITAAQDSGLTEGMRIAAFGHSLGGKLSMHLAALDERIELAAAHEPGLGFDHSNWTAPWYLGGALPNGRDQDELLGLVAPRPFLFAGGGDDDGSHNLELFRRARQQWPRNEGLDLLLHDGGHPLSAHVVGGISEWIRIQAHGSHKGTSSSAAEETLDNTQRKEGLL